MQSLALPHHTPCNSPGIAATLGDTAPPAGERDVPTTAAVARSGTPATRAARLLSRRDHQIREMSVIADSHSDRS
jgi:hypothetical protein